MLRLTDRPDMTLDVYRGRKTTKQQDETFLLHVQRTLVITAVFVTKDFAVKSNLLL